MKNTLGKLLYVLDCLAKFCLKFEIARFSPASVIDETSLLGWVRLKTFIVVGSGGPARGAAARWYSRSGHYPLRTLADGIKAKG